MLADVGVGVLNPAPRHEAGAPLVSHLRRAATTTTTSTSTTTSSTTTSSSTTSSTTTSTSTSTTTSTVPGDFTGDANWVAIYFAEDTTPASNGLSDSHTNTATWGINDLTDLACASATQDTSQFQQGSSAVLTPLSCQFRCDNGVDCTDADFGFTGASDDFTVLLFTRMTSASTGDRGQVTMRGTNIDDGWRLFTPSGTSTLCFRSGANGTAVSLCDATNWSLNTWYYFAAVYDGALDHAWLYRDGAVAASSTSMVQPAGSPNNFFVGASGNNHPGQRDQVAIYAGRLTREWVTYFGVCMVDGSQCSCNPSDPTQYLSRPRHVSQGGPIEGPMPACNDLTVDTE